MQRKRLPYRDGKWLVECDGCGFWYYNYQVQKDWQGFLMCEPCIDPKPPQYDPPKGVEKKKPKQTRPAHEYT